MLSADPVPIAAHPHVARLRSYTHDFDLGRRRSNIDIDPRSRNGNGTADDAAAE
jgi:hypothetical protein